MNKFLLITLSASVALAQVQYSPSFPILVARQQVVEVPCAEQNLKDCGTGCIQTDWTCCPSQAGGCPPTAYCEVGTNQQYGCCPNGSVCNGDGGGTTRGSTDTLTLAGGDTTTVVQQPNTASTQAPVVEGSTTAVIVPVASSAVPPVLPSSVAPIVPAPGTPVPVPTPSTVIVNAGSSNRYSLFCGVLAGFAALVV
ncbi:gpi anchored serine-threonine rich protein [Fusarium heterosporum]|uniref:Gpi anchored serine-threonine rich protein n=1 Tax=Fusarium heterosporum TaxID=42747 RepID=A0A8H5T2U4_FUSHE|nr:gpi anchored serine-threonine rich protein [Fusarium heterosporum]